MGTYKVEGGSNPKPPVTSHPDVDVLGPMWSYAHTRSVFDAHIA